MTWWILLIVASLTFAVWSKKYAWWKPSVNWQQPRILMYHMVSEHRKGAQFNKLRVTPTAFTAQMDWLKQQGFHFVTMDELQNDWGKHPAKTVAITFDDGYLDNLENAFPVLQRANAKATIYVVVDRHDRDWSTYKKAHHNSGELAREAKLSDAQVQQLAQSGLIEIGSHTISHANLKVLDDAACLHELSASRVALQALTGQAMNSFAYPFGIYTARDVAIAKQVGYTNAVTTIEGIDGSSPDFMQLKRIKVSGKDSMFAFKLRIKLGSRQGS